MYKVKRPQFLIASWKSFNIYIRNNVPNIHNYSA